MIHTVERTSKGGTSGGVYRVCNTGGMSFDRSRDL